MLRTNRGLAKFYFLSLITFGIYGLVVLCNVSIDINTIASRRDGKHTMNYLLLYFIFSWLTLGIAPLVWFHRISNRIGGQLIGHGNRFYKNIEKELLRALFFLKNWVHSI